jgi:phospholipid/cholesterol/gamma-HCH transport system permease protein
VKHLAAQPDQSAASLEESGIDLDPPFTQAVGREALNLLNTGFELFSVFVQTLYYCVRGRPDTRAVLNQMFEIGNRSLVFLTVVMGFIGMILVLQGGLQLSRIIPEFSLVGATYMELMIRDLSASIGALMLATRVGAGIAAEIGSMVVTEQIDALRMCAADPIDYLIKPRFVASIVMTVCLIIWVTAVAFITGGLTGYVMFDIQPRTFFNLQLIDKGDLIICLAKCLAYGAAIPIVSAHSGLTTHGGSEGVGWATTRAVVNTSLAIIVLDLILSALGYLIFGA